MTTAASDLDDTKLDTAERLHSRATNVITTAAADLALSLDQPIESQLQESEDLASYYWDASTMAPLNVISAVSCHTIRPPPTSSW